MKLWLAVVVSLAMSGVAWAQEDERQKSLELTTKLVGKKIELKGTVNMPDGAILNIQMQREPEMLLYGRVDSRIEPALAAASGTMGVLVEKKKFAISLDLGGPGFYRVSIMYSQFAQRKEAVLKTLGPTYTDWGRDIHLSLIDTRNVVAQLGEERVRLLDAVALLAPIADAIEDMMKSPRERRDFKAIHQKIEAAEKKVNAIKDTSFYSATLGAVVECLQRMRACSPDTTRFELPPGVSKEHVEAEMGEMPMGFSDETDLDSVRIFITRAGRAVERERLLVTLRYTLAHWESYMRAILAEESTDVFLDGVRKDWDEALALARENSKAIELELPEKKKRNAHEEALATFCQHCVETCEKMDAFAARRRGARASSREEQAHLDNKDYKETRQAFEALNAALRRVPSK